MNILYDGQIYSSQIMGGVNRYFTNIINHLPDDIYPTLTTTYSGRERLSYPSHKNLIVRDFRCFWPRRISNRVCSYYNRWIASLPKFDVYHPTYYSQLTRNGLGNIKIPVVLTVYDMIDELFSDALDPTGYKSINKREAISAADSILCISHSTKRDLLEYFPDAEPKVTVTYLASEFSRDWSYGDEPIPLEPYFLYVGSRTNAYKNFDGFLCAFSKAITSNPHPILVVVGEPFNEEENKLIHQLNIVDRIKRYGYVNDTYLAKLYRCAEAFVYPSLYEGFGIPPLEAMTCGTVVIAANSSSIPEIVGDAAILFDPRDLGELTDILLHVLDSPAEKEHLISKGYKQSLQFSWRKTAELTTRVYRKLA